MVQQLQATAVGLLPASLSTDVVVLTVEILLFPDLSQHLNDLLQDIKWYELLSAAVIACSRLTTSSLAPQTAATCCRL